MAELIKSSITGSTTDTGSLIVSSSYPITLPHLQSGSSDIFLDSGSNYQFFFDDSDNYVKYQVWGSYSDGSWTTGPNAITGRKTVTGFGTLRS